MRDLTIGQRKWITALVPATRGGTDCVLREPEDDRFGDPALLRKAGTVERRKGVILLFMVHHSDTLGVSYRVGCYINWGLCADLENGDVSLYED